jgi:hypothetical protein
MAKITLKNTQTIEDAFEDFIFYKNTQGVNCLVKCRMQNYSSMLSHLFRLFVNYCRVGWIKEGMRNTAK